MVHPRQLQTPVTEPWPVDGCDATPAPPLRRARQPADQDPRPRAEFAGASDGPVPTWEAARRALFGTDGRAGLIECCRDDEGLIAAARNRHPFLACCTHLGRDRLAYAPIRAEENDRGGRELHRLRAESEAMAVRWKDPRRRGLALEVRKREHWSKPDFAKALPDRMSWCQ